MFLTARNWGDLMPTPMQNKQQNQKATTKLNQTNKPEAFGTSLYYSANHYQCLDLFSLGHIPCQGYVRSIYALRRLFVKLRLGQAADSLQYLAVIPAEENTVQFVWEMAVPLGALDIDYYSPYIFRQCRKPQKGSYY